MSMYLLADVGLLSFSWVHLHLMPFSRESCGNAERNVTYSSYPTYTLECYCGVINTSGSTKAPLLPVCCTPISYLDINKHTLDLLSLSLSLSLCLSYLSCPLTVWLQTRSEGMKGQRPPPRQPPPDQRQREGCSRVPLHRCPNRRK